MDLIAYSLFPPLLISRAKKALTSRLHRAAVIIKAVPNNGINHLSLQRIREQTDDWRRAVIGIVNLFSSNLCVSFWLFLDESWRKCDEYARK